MIYICFIFITPHQSAMQEFALENLLLLLDY